MTNIEDISFPNWFYFDVKSQDWNDCCMRIKEEDMTYKMKEENPEYETTGWYIKVSLIEDDMKVHRRRAFDKCNDLEDMKKTLEIPNFDYDIFEEISWITKKDLDKKLWSGTFVEENKASSDDIIELNGVMYKKI